MIDPCIDPVAPASVTALQADNGHTAHSLTVAWERPAGVYDGFRLQLLDEGGGVLTNRSVAAGRRSERLEGLTSGRWYAVRMFTLSGGVPSPAATAEGQTREWWVAPVLVGGASAHLYFLCRSGRRHESHPRRGQCVLAGVLVAAVRWPRGRVPRDAPHRP